MGNYGRPPTLGEETPSSKVEKLSYFDRNQWEKAKREWKTADAEERKSMEETFRMALACKENTIGVTIRKLKTKRLRRRNCAPAEVLEPPDKHHEKGSKLEEDMLTSTETYSAKMLNDENFDFIAMYSEKEPEVSKPFSYIPEMPCDPKAPRKHRMKAAGVRADKRVFRQVGSTERGTTQGSSPKFVSTPGAVGLDEHVEIIAGTEWYDDIMSKAQEFESGQTPSAEKPPGWDFVASVEFHNACVARPINTKELEMLRLHNSEQHGNAMTAMNMEWGNLRAKGVWDPSWIRDWNGVAHTAQKDGMKIHLARISGIMVEKGSELPDNDPLRKFKYRVVYCR